MVLAQPVGRKRSFAVGLLLTIVTFGIYAVYWNYKAHNELYRQFELARENRDEGMVWYVLGLVVFPFLLAYFFVMAANVTYVRDRIGLPRRQTPARFLTLVSLAVAAVVVGLLVVEVAVSALPEEMPQEEYDAAVAAQLPVFFGFALAGLALLGIAYYGLQRDMNELWDAYHARLGFLQANPPPPAPPAPVWGAPPPPPPALPWATPHGPRASYYADLAPAPGVGGDAPPPFAAPAAPGYDAGYDPGYVPGYAPPPAASPAPPTLRERWAHLRAAHPDLGDTPTVDGLLAASDYDEAARHQAEAHLAQLRAALEARAQVARQRDGVLAAMEDLEARLAHGTVPAESYDAERALLEGEWEQLRAELDAADARLARLL